MNSLTIALACLGGVVLAGIVAHGAWQARKADPKRPEQAPVEPREPVLDAAPTERIEPTVHNEAPKSPLPVPPRRPSLRIDALIDAIASLTLESPASGEMVLAHQPHTRRAGSKPFLIEGQNAESGQWEAPLPGQEGLRVAF